jgi:hypothetical protein
MRIVADWLINYRPCRAWSDAQGSAIGRLQPILSRHGRPRFKPRNGQPKRPPPETIAASTFETILRLLPNDNTGERMRAKLYAAVLSDWGWIALMKYRQWMVHASGGGGRSSMLAVVLRWMHARKLANCDPETLAPETLHQLESELPLSSHELQRIAWRADALAHALQHRESRAVLERFVSAHVERGIEVERIAFSVVRILEPMLAEEPSGGIEFGVDDMLEHGRLVRFVRAGVAREDLLLARPSPFERATQRYPAGAGPGPILLPLYQLSSES